jgi:hypothetical protein
MTNLEVLSILESPPLEAFGNKNCIFCKRKSHEIVCKVCLYDIVRCAFVPEIVELITEYFVPEANEPRMRRGCWLLKAIRNQFAREINRKGQRIKWRNVVSEIYKEMPNLSEVGQQVIMLTLTSLD